MPSQSLLPPPWSTTTPLPWRIGSAALGALLVSLVVVAPVAQQQAARIRTAAQDDAATWLASAGHPWARLRIVDAQAVLGARRPAPPTAALRCRWPWKCWRR